MQRHILAGVIFGALVLVPATAESGEKHITGAAIGAGVGAIVAGPPGAILGGAVGAYVKGPRVTKYRHCWTGRSGRLYCEWR
jgi:outer membrane lipoprotein SlyB